MWLDVRVPAADLERAVEALRRSEATAYFTVDLHPPASGPEVELSIYTPRPDKVIAALAAFTLAYRQRGYNRSEGEHRG